MIQIINIYLGMVSNISLNGDPLNETLDASIIWQDSMTSLFNISEWQTVGNPTVTEIKDNIECAWRGFDDCWCVSGYFSGFAPDWVWGYAASIHRFDSTLGYSNLSISFNLETFSQSCSLSYSVDNDDDNWIELQQWTDPNNASQTIYLPQATWNNQGVGIKIEAINSGTDCC